MIAGLEVHVGATATAVAVSSACGLLLLALGHQSLGGEQQGSDRSRVLEGGTGHLGRVDDPGDDQILEDAGLGVEADVAGFAPHPFNHDAALGAGVDGDLTKRLLERPAHDLATGLLVVGAAAQLVDRGLRPKKGNPATGDDALLPPQHG